MALPFEVRRLLALPGDVAALQAEAAREGFRFVGKLVDEWEAGSNRFDAPGEVFAGAFVEDRLLAVGGLNIDPHSGSERTGRLRRLYVTKAARREGVGSGLVRYLLNAASGSFDRVCLRTDTSAGARFYEALGFRPMQSPTATHVMDL